MPVAESPTAGRARAGAVLLWLSILGFAVALFAAAGGSTGFNLGSLRVSIRNPTNPALFAILAGLAGARLLGGRASGRHMDALDRGLAGASAYIAAALALFVLAGTLAAGAHVAGGADSSGYLSEARLWRSGTLVQRPALAGTVPMTHGVQAFVPIGFRLAASGQEIAPIYPPGLPVTMAAASAVAGDGAVFAVVPICAAGLVMLAYVFGRRLGGAHLGLVAAAATAVSPTMLVQATQPMSDVPAAFWWMLAFVLLTFESYPTALAAGVAAAMASLVRPNLFVMVPVAAAIAAAWEDTWTRGLRRAALFAVPVVPVALGYAAWQRSIYGAATETGYGGLSSLFSPSHVVPNLSLYPAWLVDTHSPLVLAALAAPLVIARGRARRMAWGALAMFAALLAFYTAYLVFDSWAYVRFLLPALPALLTLMVAPPLVLLRRAGGPLRGAAVLALLLLVVSWGFSRSRGLGAFMAAQAEQRYVDVAAFAKTLEPRAVFVSMQHSGSLHYYTARPILRWDWTEPSEIDRAMDALREAGHAVYVVLDDWEEPSFRSRFAGTRTLTSLGRPLMTTFGPSFQAAVYRPAP